MSGASGAVLVLEKRFISEQQNTIKLEKLNPISPCRTLTELLKQPGEAGVVDGTGVHHPIGIGTNGISARALRSNNGECNCLNFFQGQ